MKKTYKAILVVIVFIILLGVLAKVFNLEDKILKKIYPKTYEEYVEKYAKEYNVDPLLVFSIIKAESNFKKDAKSTSKAKGLMQIMDSTAKEIAKKNNIELTDENILDPEINIEIGTIYLSQLIEKYNSVELAIAAYNAGHGNVDKWISQDTLKEDGTDAENIPFKETNMYVRKVMRDWKIYKSILK